MEKELYNLIEAYLEGSLPDEKQREVEARMASDEDFRQEVELHRDLQESYADPDRWQLRTALLEAMEEPLPPVEPPRMMDAESFDSRKKWWLILPVALLLGVGIWYFSLQDAPIIAPNATDSPPVHTPTTLPPTNEQEMAPGQVNQPAVQKPKESQPIAMADPSNFQENRSMEGLIAMRDVGGLTVSLARPKLGEHLNPLPSGKTAIRFSGKVEGLVHSEKVSVNLLIFNNKNAKIPLLAQIVQLNSDAKGTADFNHATQLDFPKGLYYFRFEAEEGEMLIAGKFFIGSL